MFKHYHTAIISCISLLLIGLAVSFSPASVRLGHGLTSPAMADDDEYGSDGYNNYGYDKDGYDKDGYNCDGYDKDGYDKDGGYNSSYNSRLATTGTAQSFHPKPTTKQY